MKKLIGLVSWLYFCCSLALSPIVKAQDISSTFNQWQQKLTSIDIASNQLSLTQSVSSSYTADEHNLRALLLSNANEIVISLPLPNGQLVDFNLTPSHVMAAELRQKYPEIKTFSGVQVGAPSNTGRFDITPNGFHGMFYYQGELIFVEPEIKLITSSAKSIDGVKSNQVTRTFSAIDGYQSYLGKKTQLVSRADFQFHSPKNSFGDTSGASQSSVLNEETNQVKGAKSVASQSAIKTYRLAISAAAEYTQFNGGTVDSAMAEMVTLVNRLNEVFQRDLAIKLELVANNNLLIFTDADTDPFANTSDDGEINTQTIDNIIGSNSYDIGHVVGTGGGGLAVLESVCNSQYKGDGVTGADMPNNDSFYIDYVAHEIGHQFGANHTFNGSSEACAGNRSASSAYEVGSGSTIMSYAGICGSQNLQGNSDAFFHTKSIEDISNFITTGGGKNCGTVTGSINNTAIVDAGDDYTIPAQTPFILSGSASDVDSSNLTYSWEQFDLGPASSSLSQQIDDGARPLFRTWPPVSDSERVFPQLTNILANTSVIGEVLPTTDRSLNFRLLVRDSEGGVSFDANEITVIDTGESFAVTAPLRSDIWSSNSQNVQWQVAATDTSPINCASVDVLLSIDGGNSFTRALEAGADNNGTTQVSLTNYCASEINTNTARIKVACSDNIFFAINDNDFTIDKSVSAVDIAITSQQTLSVNQGESLTFTNNLFTFGCDTPTSLTVESGTGYTVSGNSITVDNDFSGTLNVGIVSHKEAISSEVFTAMITVAAVVVPEPETETETEASTSNSSGSIFWLLSAVLILIFRTKNIGNNVRDSNSSC